MRALILLSTVVLLNLYSMELESLVKIKNKNTILTKDGSLQEAIFGADLKFDLYFDDAKIVNINRIKLDAKDKIEPDRFITDNYSTFSKPAVIGNSGIAELRELYYEKTFDDTTFKIGKKQTVWGKADGIKLLDKLNPQDFSEFILEDFQDSRIPLWSLDLIQNFENSVFEFVWIPDTTYHKLPQQNGSYSFTSSRVVPKSVSGVSVAYADVNKPNDGFKDSDIGLRYSFNLNNAEVGFYYIDSYEDFPVLYQDLNTATMTVTINSTYERSKLYGMSADYSTGDFVYRVETALTQGKYFLNSNASRGVKQSDEYAYVFGVDWYGLEESLLSIQFNQSYLLDFDDAFTRPKVDNTMTFLYKKDMMNNTLHFEILEIHNFKDNDGVVRPKIKYEWDEETLIYTGLDIFYGEKDGLYGEFRDQNRFLLGFEKTF